MIVTTEAIRPPDCDWQIVNVGRVHWCVCDTHRLKWCVGENLFSSWHDETAADWAWNAALLDEYKTAAANDLDACSCTAGGDL